MFLKEVYLHFMTPLGNPGNEPFLLPSMGEKKLGVFFVVCFFSFFLCIRMFWSDIWHEHKELDPLVDLQQKEWEDTAVLSKVLYNDLIFFLKVCFFFPQCPSLAVDDLFFLLCRLFYKSISSNELKLLPNQKKILQEEL